MFEYIIWFLNQTFESFLKYMYLWSFFQWTSSLAMIIFVYWRILNSFLNRICLKYTGRIWLTTKGRCAVIALDLGANLLIGMYYMNHRDTVMGQLMLMCPLALSPFIFVIELTLLFVYCYYYRAK